VLFGSSAKYSPYGRNQQSRQLEEKAQKLTFDDIRKEAEAHVTPNIGLDHRNTPSDRLNSAL
jgi:hypothetical protein